MSETARAREMLLEAIITQNWDLVRQSLPLLHRRPYPRTPAKLRALTPQERLYVLMLYSQGKTHAEIIEALIPLTNQITNNARISEIVNPPPNKTKEWR